MPEQGGCLAALAEPLAEAAIQHRASSRRDKSFARGRGGAEAPYQCMEHGRR
jgi:hypothetical protein